MATNENEIGVQAVLVLDQFEKSSKILDAKIAALNKDVTAFEKDMTAAAKKSSDEVAKSTEKQSADLDKLKRNYQKTLSAITFIVAGVAATYKFLEEESKRLGDTGATAAFEEQSQAVKNLGDSIAALILSGDGVERFLKFFTEGITALTQVITLAGGGLIWFLSVAEQVFSAGEKFKNYPGLRGKAEPLDMQAIIDKANAAANAAIKASVEAPGQVVTTQGQLAAAGAADKQRQKDQDDLASYYEKLRDLQIKSGEGLLEAEKDYQSKSAAAWADYIEKSNSIIADGIKKRAELQRTYADAISSAEADYQRGAEDAAYGHAQKLQDIEQNYQNTVRNIQQTYAEDALDAVRNLDALGLVRAREKRDKDLANARQSRDESNAAENQNYERQLFELQRALEDKKREAEDAYRRGLEDQRRSEQDALQSAKDAYNKQTGEAKAAYDERLAAIQNAYQNEDNAAAAHYLNQEAALVAHLQAMQAIMAAYGMSTGTIPKPGKSPVRRRASGGLDFVDAPTHFLAGEAGPEMVYTAPLNRALPMPSMQTVNHVGDFSHSIEAAVSSSVAGFDGRITAAVRKALGEVLR